MNTAGNSQSPLFGLAAEFSSAEELMQAARGLRAAGYRRFDVFSPFPIPHMNEAMGLRRSLLGRVVFVGGLIGFAGAVALQLIPGEFLYPLIAGGRPTNLTTVAALVPIVFELTILCAALTTFAGLLMVLGLPRWNHPLFHWEEFQGASDDRFFAVIEAADPDFSLHRAEELFLSLGAKHITRVHEDWA